MSEENTFAIYPQKVLARDVAVDDYICVYGIPCYTARIRTSENNTIMIEGYGVYTHQYHERAFQPDEEIEVPVVIRGEVSVFPNY